MTGLALIIGILVTVFIVYLTIEVVPATPAGQLESAFGDASASARPDGIRGRLAPFEKYTAKVARPGMLREVASKLYWAQMTGQFTGWTPVQFITLQFATAAAAFTLFLLAAGDPLPAVMVGFLGYAMPSFRLNGAARKAQRTISGQLPEFLQLISAQMAAGASLEESMVRSSRAPSLIAAWLRRVIQSAQGRGLIDTFNVEAQASSLPELIEIGMQLKYIAKGVAMQELMGQLALKMSSEYISQAGLRAEKLSSSLILPLIIMYFVPFLVVMLALFGLPLLGILG